MDKKADKKPKKGEEKESAVSRLQGWFKDIQGEFKKIIWPDRKSLIRHTFNVLLVSGAIGGVIIIMDLVFSRGYTLFTGLF